MMRDRLRQVEDDLSKAKVALEKALRERSQLDHKLAVVTTENSALTKKASVQERVLDRGESMYQEKEEDIRVLKLEIKRLRHDEAYLQKSSQNMEEMKKEVLQLQKDLLHEKTKVKSLKTELENPLNIHRWRKLEGKDPTTLELIQKIHSLQKRLIARKEDIVDRELSLQEKDKVVAELRANLARQPGTDVMDEARSLNVELQNKTKLIQGLAAERNMYMTDNEQVRQKMNTMAEELNESRRKALDLSKKHQKLLAKFQSRFTMDGGLPSVIHQEITVLSSVPSSIKPKFVGGGFNLSSATSFTPGTA
jgi:chromosome segregation ATPase